MKRIGPSLTMVVVMVAAATAAGAVTLRHQGKPGEVRKYAFGMAMRMQGDTMGMRERMESTLASLLAQKVTSVDDGVLTIEQKLIKGKTKMKMEGIDEPMEEELPEVTTVIKIDAHGRVRQFKIEDGAMAADPTQGFVRVLSEIGRFPERELKVGDSWSDEKEISESDMGTIKVQYTRKLTALEQYQKRNCAKIETRFAGSVAPSEDMMDGDGIPGAEFQLSINFVGTTVVWFDHEAGLVVEENDSLKMLTETSFTMPAVGAGEDVERSSKMAMMMNAKTVLQK